MYGAMLGDLVGSRFEHNNVKRKGFPLLSDLSHFTDDSIMTIAIAEAIMNYYEYDNGTEDLSGENDAEKLASRFIVCMRKWGWRYPNAGYGGRFYEWLKKGGEPYNSWGNGSAMRVSPVAWLFNDIDVVRKAAAISAEVTHNHPEGIKGAEAIASAVYLARKGEYKPYIREFIEKEFGYDLSRTCDEIRPDYTIDVSCQGSVPEAIISFLEGRDVVDVVRNAVSLGGDSDTIAAMAGAIAEAYYGMDHRIRCEVIRKLKDDQLAVVERFEDMNPSRTNTDEAEHINVSRARISLLPDNEREIAHHYIEINNLRKTAEAFNISESDATAILRKAEKYHDRRYRDNISIEEYINELSPIKFVRGEKRKLPMVCGTWIKEDDELVIDMVRFSEKSLSADEICTMTGLSKHSVKHTLSMIDSQKRMYEGRRKYLFDDDIEDYPDV